MVDTDTQVQLSEEQLKALAPAQAREHISRLEEENAAKDNLIRELRGDVLGRHLQSIGLDAGQGLGKAIAREYQGEVSAEAVAKYALEEYNHTAPTDDDAPSIPPDPVVQEITEGTQVADQLQAQSQPATPAPDPHSVGEMDRKMADPEATREDAQAAIAAKTAAFRKHFGIATG